MGACFACFVSPPTAKPVQELARGCTLVLCVACDEAVPRPMVKLIEGRPHCRNCCRRKEELSLEPLTEEERQGLVVVRNALETSVPYWTNFTTVETPAQILPWLYLGGLDAAMNFDWLAQRGISTVINLVHWWELDSRLSERSQDFDSFLYLYASRDIRLCIVDAMDSIAFDIQEPWQEVEVVLQECASAGHNVLVHCAAGHNRSAFMVVAWLLQHEGMSLSDALVLCQQRRNSSILSNVGFRLQLVRNANRHVGEPAAMVREMSSADKVTAITDMVRYVAGDATEQLTRQVTDEIMMTDMIRQDSRRQISALVRHCSGKDKNS